MCHFGPKIAYPHKSGSFGRILHSERANKQMRTTLIIFKKKIVCGKWTILDPEMAHPHNSGSEVRNFKILHNQKDQQEDESNNNGLYQKKFAQDKLAYFGL